LLFSTSKIRHLDLVIHSAKGLDQNFGLSMYLDRS